MARITVPPISRSIPTPIQYQVERIESTSYEFTDDGMDNNDRLNRIEAYRLLQTREIDALDDRVRACYGMQPRRYGYGGPPTVPPFEFTTADKVGSAEARLGKDAALPTAPPASSISPQPVLVPAQAGGQGPQRITQPPTTRPNDPAPRAAPAPRSAPETKAEPAKAWPSPSTLKPGEKKCTDAAHPVSKPRFISDREYNVGVQVHGQPLCDDHLQARRPRA